MFKRIFFLVLISSIISAGLLYLGITLMERYTPALASSLGAVVAREGEPQASTLDTQEDVSIDAGPRQQEDGFQISPYPEPTSNPPVEQPSVQPSGTAVTIAELSQNPTAFRCQVITVSGISDSLANDKMLLNDGTGQILIDIDDSSGVNTNSMDGMTISVVGMLDLEDSNTVLELEACTIENQTGIFFVDDDCTDDRGGDDHGRHDGSDDHGHDDDRFDDHGGDDRFDDHGGHGGSGDRGGDDRIDDNGSNDAFDDHGGDRDSDDHGHE